MTGKVNPSGTPPIVSSNSPVDPRRRDWADDLAEYFGITFQTVRGVFQEGEVVFNGAAIKRKSHIQVAVRDPHAIIGYFRPEEMNFN